MIFTVLLAAAAWLLAGGVGPAVAAAAVVGVALDVWAGVSLGPPRTPDGEPHVVDLTEEELDPDDPRW